MTQLVSFPGLGIELNINPIAFSLGNINIFWYGILATVGIMLGVLYALKRSPEFGLDPDKLLDLMMYTIFAGIIGARIYYVAFSWDSYKDNLIDIFKIYEGGIAIYGSLIGGAIAAYFICKKFNMNFFSVADVIAAPLLLGQGIGRWGNFINVEAFGSNTTLPWGMTSSSITTYLIAMKDSLAHTGVVVDPFMPVHPTFFYESIWCLIGFGVIAWYTSRRRFNGELALIYAVWNGSGRFVIEGLRTDSLMLGNVRISQVLAGAAVLAAVYMLVTVKKRTTPEDSTPYSDPPVEAEAGANGAQAPGDIIIEKSEEDTDGTVN